MITPEQSEQPERFVDTEQFDMPVNHVLAEGNEDHVVYVRLVTQQLDTDKRPAQFVRVECAHPKCDWWNDLV